MLASPYIVPHIIPYKDLISVVADIEKEIKGATNQVGRSNEELMADYLRGGDYLGSIPLPPPPEGVGFDGTEGVEGEVEEELAEEGLDNGPIMQMGEEGAISSA